MIFDPYNPVFNTIFVYILVMSILLLQKPSIIYNKKHKRFKQFGVGKNKSLLSLPILAIVLAIVFYIIFASIERFCVLQDEYYEIIDKNSK